MYRFGTPGTAGGVRAIVLAFPPSCWHRLHVALEDALAATRAAAREGYVAGGGVAYIRAIDAIEKERKNSKGDAKLGFDILASALESPASLIASNGGDDGDVVVEKIKEGNGGFGFNASTQTYEDLIKAGIIDPALVVCTAIQNAASVAGLLITTEATVAELPEDKSSAGAPDMGGMGGMGGMGF